MATEKVRFGVIGVGGMGSGHCGMIPKIPETELTAVCDTNRGNAAENNRKARRSRLCHAYRTAGQRTGGRRDYRDAPLFPPAYRAGRFCAGNSRHVGKAACRHGFRGGRHACGGESVRQKVRRDVPDADGTAEPRREKDYRVGRVGRNLPRESCDGLVPQSGVLRFGRVAGDVGGRRRRRSHQSGAALSGYVLLARRAALQNHRADPDAPARYRSGRRSVRVHGISERGARLPLCFALPKFPTRSASRFAATKAKL